MLDKAREAAKLAGAALDVAEQGEQDAWREMVVLADRAPPALPMAPASTSEILRTYGLRPTGNGKPIG